ncbi:hypothetical protein M422DRAFT_242063 [Sphaerobolus stellatus SS14]|nr:hypothetical protein M422DRAFT_242063 [Sphaerobolus stellatus SS14]
MSSTLQAAQLLPFITVQRTLVFNNVAATSFFFWEFCITLPDELRLVWGEKRTFASVLFIMSRYLTFINRVIAIAFYTDAGRLMTLGGGGCMVWAWAEAVTGHTIYVSVEILLIMRIYAFYERKRSILLGLWALWIVEHGLQLGILFYALPRFNIIGNPMPSNRYILPPACIILSTPSIFKSYWQVSLKSDSIPLLIFSLYRIPGMFASTKLLSVFVRDGAWLIIYFGMIAWCCMAFELNAENGDIALTWLFSTLGIIGTRVVLNLRKTSLDMHNQSDLYNVLMASCQSHQMQILNSLTVSYPHASTYPHILSMDKSHITSHPTPPSSSPLPLRDFSDHAHGW